MEKSRDAFRTISEVAEWLDVPTHVLRFWESRFSQIKPVKRAGGRRYYRPSDMALIGGIKVLLHDQGMTIRGVQKMLRESGIKHVSGYSPPLHPDDAAKAEADVIEATPLPVKERPVSIPAPPARATHEAEPAPIKDEPAPLSAEREGDDAQPDMFPDEAPPEAPAVAKSIPATPDVPETDPGDADESHPGEPGLAARLVLGRVDAGHTALRDAAHRLRDLRDRLSE